MTTTVETASRFERIKAHHAVMKRSVLASEYFFHQGLSDGWDSIIAELKDWRRDPSRFDDDEPDLVPPTETAIVHAIELSRDMRDQNLQPPSRVVPTGEGGVSLSRMDSGMYERMDIEDDGRTEYFRFVNSKLEMHCVLYEGSGTAV